MFYEESQSAIETSHIRLHTFVTKQPQLQQCGLKNAIVQKFWSGAHTCCVDA